MRLIKARKLHRCKKCRKDIWPNAEYYPQRNAKAICFGCGRKKRIDDVGFINWLLGWLR